MNDGDAGPRENPRIATCYEKLACVCIAAIIAKAQSLRCYPPRLPMTGFDENKLVLSGSHSKFLGSGDGLTLSSGIGGAFASDPVNCDGHWIAAGKRQVERLVEKGVNSMIFLTFRGGARSFRV